MTATSDNLDNMEEYSSLSVFHRKLTIDLDSHNAFFLWGPRKVGKTTYLKQHYSDAHFFDLLDTQLQMELKLTPRLFREEILAYQYPLVIVDEIQKLPFLLDEVHWLLENTRTKFILCGSSARKLKRCAANLLGGRAWRYELFPLISAEIPNFDLSRALQNGLIPQHYLAENPEKFLHSYILDYLNEEIQIEAQLRQIESFHRFLELVATTHGQLINYANIARQCGVSSKTVQSYFQILADTLLGFTLKPWTKSKKCRLIETAKFYLFDPGVVRTLKGNIPVVPKTDEFGRAFEHFIINEVRAYLSYQDLYKEIYYWRTSTNLEVDLIIGNMDIAIEIKATEHVNSSDLKGLNALMADQKVGKALVVSLDKTKRLIDNRILVLPWQDFCQELWTGQFII